MSILVTFAVIYVALHVLGAVSMMLPEAEGGRAKLPHVETISERHARLEREVRELHAQIGKEDKNVT